MNVISEKVQHYFSLIKFSHTVFALPFAVTGYFLGIRYSGNPIDWLLLLKVVACMVFARSAAMGFNRYIDRRFDILNARTAGREIHAGLISIPV
jgi:4-hydroxybenzoate polyprenyltransferase